MGVCYLTAGFSWWFCVGVCSAWECVLCLLGLADGSAWECVLRVSVYDVSDSEVCVCV